MKKFERDSKNVLPLILGLKRPK